jgi:hypothetical protein
MIIDSDFTIRNISRYHDAYPNMKIYRKYICLLSDTANCPEDLYQISSKNRIYGIYRNMTTESTFPIRICCLCFGDNNRKERRIFRHGG